jgi:hypothetical protein
MNMRGAIFRENGARIRNPGGGCSQNQRATPIQGCGPLSQVTLGQAFFTGQVLMPTKL